MVAIEVSNGAELNSLLTHRRVELARHLRKVGPTTILGLSKALGRAYANVHSDCHALMDAGVLRRGGDGLVAVQSDRLVVSIAL